MTRWLVVVILIAVLISGCGDGKRTIAGRQTPQKGQISKEELRNELDRFQYLIISGMRRTSDEVYAADTTRRGKRTSALLQSRVIEALHAMAASDDPVAAFYDTWALIARMAIYFREGAGRSVYGDQQPKVLAFIEGAEEDIERIGHLFMTDEQFKEVKKNVYRFAQQYPIEARYSNLIIYATQEKQGEIGVLMKTLSIPMAPIRALEGVDNTAKAISQVRDSVDQFTNVAEQMPESARWQMSILMDDFEESEMTQSFLKNMNEFSQNSARLVELLETMPEQIRTELLTVLDESNESQLQLQVSLQKATEAAGQIEKTLAQLDTTSQTLTQDLEMFKGKPRDPNGPPGFGMRDFDNMLLNAGQTADKVSAAVAQIHQTVGTVSEKETQKRLRSLIDHVMWRLFELILAVLLIIYGGRWVFKKLQTEKFSKNANP